jgi:hypothetical protein
MYVSHHPRHEFFNGASRLHRNTKPLERQRYGKCSRDDSLTGEDLHMCLEHSCRTPIERRRLHVVQIWDLLVAPAVLTTGTENRWSQINARGCEQGQSTSSRSSDRKTTRTEPHRPTVFRLQGCIHSSPQALLGNMNGILTLGLRLQRFKCIRSYVGGVVNQMKLGQHILTGKQTTAWETGSTRRHDKMGG